MTPISTLHRLNTGFPDRDSAEPSAPPCETHAAPALGDPTLQAETHLGRLDAKVTAMRAVLVGLLQEVVVAQTRLESSHANLLQQANAQPVDSALMSEADADTARAALDEAARIGGLDHLTGLPNRIVLLDRVEIAIAHARRRGHQVALLSLDVDASSLINDQRGQAAGNHALQLAADCLSSLVRQSDTVSRHGGDEFMILLSEVACRGDALRVADKVDAALAAHSRTDPRLFRLRASIGISVYPEDGENARALIACAERSMSLARQQASDATWPAFQADFRQPSERMGRGLGQVPGPQGSDRH